MSRGRDVLQEISHAQRHRAAKIATTRALHSRRRVLAQLDRVADGQRRTARELARIVGDVERFLRSMKFIPWLTIDRTGEGTLFHIDHALRAICEGEAPRPEFSGRSIHEFLRTLRAEITRRRKENHDERRRSRWDSQLIRMRFQTGLLDWIEEQLDLVPPPVTGARSLSTADLPSDRSASKDGPNVHQNQRDARNVQSSSRDGVLDDVGPQR